MSGGRRRRRSARRHTWGTGRHLAARQLLDVASRAVHPPETRVAVPGEERHHRHDVVAVVRLRLRRVHHGAHALDELVVHGHKAQVVALRRHVGEVAQAGRLRHPQVDRLQLGGDARQVDVAGFVQLPQQLRLASPHRLQRLPRSILDHQLGALARRQVERAHALQVFASRVQARHLRFDDAAQVLNVGVLLCVHRVRVARLVVGVRVHDAHGARERLARATEVARHLAGVHLAPQLGAALLHRGSVEQSVRLEERVSVVLLRARVAEAQRALRAVHARRRRLLLRATRVARARHGRVARANVDRPKHLLNLLYLEVVAQRRHPASGRQRRQLSTGRTRQLAGQRPALLLVGGQVAL